MSTSSDQSNAEAKKGKPVANAPVASYIDLNFDSRGVVEMKIKDKEHYTKAHRFEKLFNYAAKIDDKDYQKFFYKVLCSLMLTSHAKKLNSSDIRKHIFDVKNRLIDSLLKDVVNRRKLSYVYLKSQNFRVEEYCKKCAESNKSLEREEWKFCKSCKVDWTFFDVICIQHFFKQGKVNLFLGGDERDKFPKRLLKKKGKLKDYKEEMILFDNLHFTTRNMSSIDLKSAITISEKLLV